MEEVESRAEPLPATAIDRDVEDTWVKIKTLEVEAFTEHINTMFENVRFTCADVRGRSLAFLDCAVHIEGDRSLNIKIYKEPTYTDQYLCMKFHCHHHL